MVITERLKRPAALASAALLLVASVVPVLSIQKASAYGQLDGRQVKMSSSVTSATGVDYYVEFKAGTTATVKSLVVDFCPGTSTPIIGDACVGAVGTDVPNVTSSTVVTDVLNEGNIGAGWTVSVLNAGRTFTISKGTGVAMTAGTTYYFTIKNVANHSTNGTFYSRILTYPNDTLTNSASEYVADNVGSPTDAGGAALSLSTQITVTAKVQERLTFCVYTTGTGNDCTTKTGNSINLGDTNGVLSAEGVYVDKSAKYSVQTNATGNVAIRMKGNTLTSGSFSIDAAGASELPAPAANAEFFGMCNYQSAGLNLTASIPYAGGIGNCSATTQTSGTSTTGGDGGAEFAYDTTATGLGSVYGQTIASKAPGDFSTGTLALIGQVANTTEAGIYTATLTFIATGTY